MSTPVAYLSQHVSALINAYNEGDIDNANRAVVNIGAAVVGILNQMKPATASESAAMIDAAKRDGHAAGVEYWTAIWERDVTEPHPVKPENPFNRDMQFELYRAWLSAFNDAARVKFPF